MDKAWGGSSKKGKIGRGKLLDWGWYFGGIWNPAIGIWKVASSAGGARCLEMKADYSRVCWETQIVNIRGIPIMAV